MKRILITSALTIAAATATASATTGVPWSDDFESGVGGSYQPWPGGAPAQNSLGGDTSHALSGTHSARAFATDPGAWSSSYTLSSGTSGVTGGLSTDVYVFEDNNVVNSGANPVNAMLAFAGANGTATPGFGTDYAELGIISGNTANLNDYVIRVRSYDQANGTTWFDTGVPRTQGWTHLQIVADPLPSDGGDGLYHFYINGNNVDPAGKTLARNSSVGLEWDRIGSNSVSHQDFWYDNFNIQAVPEPTGIALGFIGMGTLALRRRRTCR